MVVLKLMRCLPNHFKRFEDKPGDNLLLTNVKEILSP